MGIVERVSGALFFSRSWSVPQASLPLPVLQVTRLLVCHALSGWGSTPFPSTSAMGHIPGTVELMDPHHFRCSAPRQHQTSSYTGSSCRPTKLGLLLLLLLSCHHCCCCHSSRYVRTISIPHGASTWAPQAALRSSRGLSPSAHLPGLPASSVLLLK